jgi:hypothetical protein
MRWGINTVQGSGLRVQGDTRSTFNVQCSTYYKRNNGGEGDLKFSPKSNGQRQKKKPETLSFRIRAVPFPESRFYNNVQNPKL